MKAYKFISFLCTACFIAAVLLLLPSCEKEIKLPIVEASSKIVLLGELTAGDTVLVRAGQSAPFSPDSTIFKIIQSLQLTITDPSGTPHWMQQQEDFNSETLKTLPFSNPLQLQAGSTYTIRSIHPTLDSVQCSVFIPKPFTASIKDTASKIYAGVQVKQLDIEIQDDPATDNYYVVEVIKEPLWIQGQFLHDGMWQDILLNRELYDSLKRLGPVTTQFDTIEQGMSPIKMGLYTTDSYTENVKFGSAFSIYGRIMIDDRTFSGGNYTLTIFAEKANYLTDIFPGRTAVKVKSVSREYFNYLRVYERSNLTEATVGAGVPLKLEGNVKNGLGVVGGVYLRKFNYYFDDFGF